MAHSFHVIYIGMIIPNKTERHVIKILVSTEMNDVIYKLVIETNGYAGNYSRELCALITLEYGECETGKDIANYEISLLTVDSPNDVVVFIRGSEGDYSPVNVSARQCNAIEIQLHDPLDEAALSFIISRLTLLDKISDRISTGVNGYTALEKVKILSVGLIKEETIETEVYRII